MIRDADFNLPSVVQEVRRAFERYEAALRGNDVELLVNFFVARADTVRYGIGERAYGAAEIGAWRRAAAPVHPGRRLLQVIVVSYGTDVASVSAEFEVPDSTQRGRQSQTWVRIPDGWKIAAAHVSMID